VTRQRIKLKIQKKSQGGGMTTAGDDYGVYGIFFYHKLNSK